MRKILSLIIIVLGLILFTVIFKVGFDISIASYFKLDNLTYLQSFGFIIVISILRGIFSEVSVSNEKE